MRAFAEHAAQQQALVTQPFESSAMKAISELAASQQRLAKQFFDSPTWKSAIEASRRWDEANGEILGLLAPRGWVISPSSTLADLSALIAIADAEGVEGVEAKLMAELTPDRCREIIETLAPVRASLNGAALSVDAMLAHAEGRYALTVPVWLIALDGIFLIELRSEVFKQARKKDGGDLGRLSPGARERLLDALITAIQFVAEQLPRGAEPAPGGFDGTQSCTDATLPMVLSEPQCKASCCWKCCISISMSGCEHHHSQVEVRRDGAARAQPLCNGGAILTRRCMLPSRSGGYPTR